MSNDPEPGSAEIEQAVYTWSSHDVDGKSGQGFVALSPGLRQHGGWLSAGSRDVTRLAPPGGAQSSGTGDARRRFREVGRVCYDGSALGFHKDASAGRDLAGRPRHVVHVLVAHRSVLTVERLMAIRSEWWLDGDKVPLDVTPSLTGLTLDDVPLCDDIEDLCSMGDGAARRLLVPMYERLRAQSRLGELTESRSRALLAALLALPDVALDRLELRTYFDGSGPQRELRLRPNDAEGNSVRIAAPPMSWISRLRSESVDSADLFDLWTAQLQHADQLGRPASRRAKASQTDQRIGADTETVNDEIVAAWIDRLADGTASELARDDIYQLSEDQCVSVLRGLRRQDMLGAALLSLPTAVLKAVLAKVSSTGALRALDEAFADASAEAVADAWQRTRIRGLLYVLLNTHWRCVPGEQRMRWPPQTSQLLLEVLPALVESGPNVPGLSWAIGRGLLDDQSLTDSFLEWWAGYDPATLYARIIPDAQLSSTATHRLMTADWVGFCDWAGLPDFYRKVIHDEENRTGRLARWRQLFSVRRRADSSDETA